MEEHKSYDKEKMLKKSEGEKQDKFIWSYIIRPVRKDFDDSKWTISS